MMWLSPDVRNYIVTVLFWVYMADILSWNELRSQLGLVHNQ